MVYNVKTKAEISYQLSSGEPISLTALVSTADGSLTGCVLVGSPSSASWSSVFGIEASEADLDKHGLSNYRIRPQWVRDRAKSHAVCLMWYGICNMVIRQAQTFTLQAY